MDLIKAWNRFPQDFFSAYGFAEYAIALIASYCSKRYQCAKNGSSFSLYLEIFRGVPQSLILGPILFNLFINGLVLFIQETKVCNFANDKIIYSYSPNFKEATSKLSIDTFFILNWFRINSMVGNPSKFQIMFPGSNIDNNKITVIKNMRVKSRSEAKLPDI